MSKYFTPEIEDIRIGYECEMSTDGFEFFKTKIDLGDITDLIDWYKQGYFNTNDLSNIFKTPYLTKEQIEAEGWTFDKDNYGTLEFYKWETEVRYNPKRRSLNVFMTGSKPPTELFLGQCKDINTFRYICKLLGI